MPRIWLSGPRLFGGLIRPGISFALSELKRLPRRGPVNPSAIPDPDIPLKKMPLRIRVIVWTIVAFALWGLFCAALLLIGLAFAGEIDAKLLDRYHPSRGGHYIGGDRSSYETDEYIDPLLYDALIMDTQGSELLVLQGFGNLLKSLRYVKTEAADFEAYENCATVASVTEFLRIRGFRLVTKYKFADHPNLGAYYDVIFERAAPSS